MAATLSDIILDYIDDALDIDDLENISDYIQSILAIEGLQNWQLTDVLRKLYSDLNDEMLQESDNVRRMRIKAALSCIEADFSDYLISKETESFPAKHKEG